MLRVRVRYYQDEDTWVAESPDLDEHWLAVAGTLEEAHQLAEDGIRFVLERDDVDVVHLVPASV
ncbi:MAG TPA: hypothetical protein VK506_02985 [Conexibacter sp.]|nr:hypothetical protein [Conexibacter sp.]